jgi:hypothetical protein
MIFVPLILLVFSLTYFFVDFSQEVTLTGVLSNSTFPVSRFGSAPAIGDTRKYFDLEVLTLLDENSDPVFLHYGGRTEMMLVNSTGTSKIYGVTLDEIHEAYRLGLEVEVRGERYSETRNGEKYEIIHVTSFKVIS